MQLRPWFRPPRQVLTIFLGVAVVCAVALGWLGWLLLEQDIAVESQRRRERLDEGADRAVAVMQRSLANLDAKLGSRIAGAESMAGVTLVYADSAGTSTRAEPGLLYYPDFVKPAEAPQGAFADAERLEFALQNLSPAALAYERITGSADAAIRAGALTRLARVYRKLHDSSSAEHAYTRLARIPSADVGGLPAGLIAREGRASLFAETHRTSELQREAAALKNDLRSGRWQLTKQQYEFYASEAAAWLGKPEDEDTDAHARAEAFFWLWQNRPAEGTILHRLIRVGGLPALVVANQTGSHVSAAIAGPGYLTALCAEAIPGSGFQWGLEDAEGRTVLGQAPPPRGAALRTAATTRLPWTLQIFPAEQRPESGPTPRRRLLLWVFAMLAVVLTAGTYFILRAISKELRVARLQTDFVSAVSHEFRSPLSSLSQISEMLVRDRFSSGEQRRKSYDVLARETERLRRLVEGLLDFGRLEAGAAVYRFEELEVTAFLREIVAEFQERITAQGYSIELRGPANRLHIRADREALSAAIWNLLDNAVKYSPQCRTVWVDLEYQPHRVLIAVRDRGLGIPAREQREIFNKFVRGEESKALRIKGTGIGLAMVRHIVEAHGGEIRVASEPGQGSQFTMVLAASGGVS
jgi:signal transduction histidine kinase